MSGHLRQKRLRGHCLPSARSRRRGTSVPARPPRTSRHHLKMSEGAGRRRNGLVRSASAMRRRENIVTGPNPAHALPASVTAGPARTTARMKTVAGTRTAAGTRIAAGSVTTAEARIAAGARACVSSPSPAVPLANPLAALPLFLDPILRPPNVKCRLLLQPTKAKAKQTCLTPMRRSALALSCK